MNKPIYGLLLGAVLGILDGLTAWFTPEVRSQLTMIVVGSTMKGLLGGLLIGLFARKILNIRLGIIFGLAIGALLAFEIGRAHV